MHADYHVCYLAQNLIVGRLNDCFCGKFGGEEEFAWALLFDFDVLLL